MWSENETGRTGRDRVGESIDQRGGVAAVSGMVEFIDERGRAVDLPVRGAEWNIRGATEPPEKTLQTEWMSVKL